MSKRIITVCLTVFFSVLVASGIVYAATHNITSQLGGAAGDTFQVNGTFATNSLKVGSQGAGGVTYFNGTIINNTTASGTDNPVTFGDNMRIDGRVFRGATAGPSLGDSKPVIINDDLEVAGTIKMNGTESIIRKKVYSGKFNIAGYGNHVVRVDSDPSCSNPDDIKYNFYHYKIISVPEMTPNNMPSIQTYAKTHEDNIFYPQEYQPNSGNIWIALDPPSALGMYGSVSYDTGKVFILYKVESEPCTGANSMLNLLTGDYRIAVVY